MLIFKKDIPSLTIPRILRHSDCLNWKCRNILGIVKLGMSFLNINMIIVAILVLGLDNVSKTFLLLIAKKEFEIMSQENAILVCVTEKKTSMNKKIIALQ